MIGFYGLENSDLALKFSHNHSFYPSCSCNDEFEGTELDISQWSTALAYGKPNNDLRYSSESKYLYVADGSLHISTIQNPGESIPTSSIIISKEEWTKGYFEARVKIPSGKGTWPAFWLAPFAADWPLSGEIDI